MNNAASIDLAKLFAPGTRFTVSGHPVKAENGTFEMGRNYGENNGLNAAPGDPRVWRSWTRVSKRSGEVLTGNIPRNLRGDTARTVSRWISDHGVSIEILSAGEVVEAPEVDAVETVEAEAVETEAPKSAFVVWLETYLDESEHRAQRWELVADDGMTHFIGTDEVIEMIKVAPKHEQDGIKNVIVKIDFAAGDINHFFRHLAGALINA